MTKIQRALLMAFQGQREQPDVMPLVKRAVDWLRPEGDVSVGRVSDVVESVLIEAGHARVARLSSRSDDGRVFERRSTAELAARAPPCHPPKKTPARAGV